MSLYIMVSTRPGSLTSPPRSRAPSGIGPGTRHPLLLHRFHPCRYSLRRYALGSSRFVTRRMAESQSRVACRSAGPRPAASIHQTAVRGAVGPDMYLAHRTDRTAPDQLAQAACGFRGLAPVAHLGRHFRLAGHPGELPPSLDSVGQAAAKRESSRRGIGSAILAPCIHTPRNGAYSSTVNPLFDINGVRRRRRCPHGTRGKDRSPAALGRADAGPVPD